ncbi:MAG: 4Fe-4S binding protein [Oscillospiraceae bacterium]|nr:4Fe-4S binding protein [Oscillospiraceae bacterium]
MALYQIYFSPTGSTQKVCEIMGGVWNSKTTVIDLLNASHNEASYSFAADDVCLIAVPSFGGRVPVPAAKTLSRFSGNGAKAVLICTFGNRAYDDTLLELYDILKKAGFRCMAAAAAVTQHSIIQKFGKGRPNAADEEELTAFAAKIKEDIAKTEEKELTLPGKRPYRQYDGVPLKPSATKKCKNCGKCAVECPVNAISPEDCHITDNKKCISCMHCVTVCPTKARKNSSFMLFVAGQTMKKSCTSPKKNELFL